MQWSRTLLAGMLVLACAEVPALQLQGGEARDTPRDSAAPPQPAAGEDQREQPPAPASGFTPSEKIGADSAVSFPVDI